MTRHWWLLHGLGATGAAWAGVHARLIARGHHVTCPDLAGHGDGQILDAYTLDALAESLLLMPNARESLNDAIVVGHSLGGYVALALATGRYGVLPRAVMTLGSKLTFSDEERARMADLAARPARVFASKDEALERYRKVSGLERDRGATDVHWARGVRPMEAGWRLSTDPRVNAIEVPAYAELMAQARCPVTSAAGAKDTMVSAEDLRAINPRATLLDGVGHNAQVENPEAVMALLERVSL